VKRSNRLVIFLGVLLAVAAFVGIVILLNNPGGGVNQNQPQKVNVLIAKVNIAIGDPVTPDKVEVSEVLPAAVSGTPMSDPSQVAGQPALAAVPKGSQVSAEVIGGGSGSGPSISSQLKPGEKAIAFQVDRVTGLDFLVKAGDHVDIVLSERITVLQPTQDSAGKPASQRRFETVQGLDAVRTVKTVLQNKRVLYVSQSRTVTQAATASASPAPGGQAQTPATIDRVVIVIAGTDQDSEVIKFAQNDVSEIGVLTAVLRNTQDSATEKTTGITIDRLVTQYGLAIPNIIKSLSPGR
jgi:Flp pilus assembly protein CpaB